MPSSAPHCSPSRSSTTTALTTLAIAALTTLAIATTPPQLLDVHSSLVTRALSLLVVLLASAASSADLLTATRHARETSGQKPQWAPSGNLQALHTRAVFPSESRSGAGSYAREHRETAAAKSVWSYANLNPSRYSDPDGRSAATDYCTGLSKRAGGKLNFGACIAHFNKRGPIVETEFNKTYRTQDSASQKLVFGFGLSYCLPCQVGWDGSKSIDDAQVHGRGHDARRRRIQPATQRSDRSR